MVNVIESFATGTVGLLAVLLISTCLVVTRRGTSHWNLGPARGILGVSLLFHLLHLAEETIFGFHRAFPELLGRAPWPIGLFLAFNFAWIALWTSGLVVAPLHRFHATLYWFLAIASMVNGLAHPMFSIATGAYFPGLLTSPVVGILGILLLQRLYQSTAGSAS